ncbi:DUF5682 family protein [Thermocatellispora tengchongensis]|uniref:DUF5682 family protein n=1 Tax=Thermocatellispora tengchongensis TaxID=1073253 RepID=UPI0036293EFC
MRGAVGGRVSVLGVRHHGPGSARAVRAELERLAPDIVLIEGPPEADALVALAGSGDMEPPVALLAHVPGEPARSAFWPFATFSPEWQAIQYALRAGVPVRFCDLPAAVTLAGQHHDADAEPEGGDAGMGADTGMGADAGKGGDAGEGVNAGEGGNAGGGGDAREREDGLRVDPLAVLAEAAGYDDPERWWEDVIEHRGAETETETETGTGTGTGAGAGAGTGTDMRARAGAGTGADIRAREGTGAPAEVRAGAGGGASAEVRVGAGGGASAEVRVGAGGGASAEVRVGAGGGASAEVRVGTGTGAPAGMRSGADMDARTVTGAAVGIGAGVGGGGVFEAVAEAIAAVREGYTPGLGEARREAYMRRVLRRALKDGFQRVAVVCGAWHVPALTGLPAVGADDRLLRGLPKVKVEMTWVPWTYGRLASWSGYGAGVTSPGWYHHLFAAPDRPVERWLADAAGVLREEGLAVSPAHVIESVRLARSLAALRGRPLAGLAEVTEAARAVLCEGDDLPVELIQRRMVVGERLGRVPEDTPMVPLQRHLREEQRRLKLKPEALERDLDLDLRKPLDLGRSHLLHRLRLLGVRWGTPREAQGKGTFRESWRLAWSPEFDVALIEAGAWGTTVPAAATAQVLALARDAGAIAELTGLVERCLLADLPMALPGVLRALSDRAALDPDVTHLMAALPAMARARRYGDVRGTPAAGLDAIVSSMLARVCAGLSPAMTGLDDDAARELLGHVDGVHAATSLLDAGSRAEWLAALRGVAGRRDLHGLVAGRLTRILLDAGELASEEAASRMSLATSAGHPPARVAAWVEGFLSGDGLLLVHDPRLLGLVDGWLAGLAPEAFVDVLPLLRRTFGTFEAPERRAIGRRVRAQGGRRAEEPEAEIDETRAAPAVRTVLTILGRAR